MQSVNVQSVNVEILINGKRYAGELKEVEAAARTTTSDEMRQMNPFSGRSSNGIDLVNKKSTLSTGSGEFHHIKE
ncbi:hypothetical protein PAECIP111893_02432 [Paenibacillus plantiphilus]|uniref:Uncharacterized protein n=1 Tax=Paenibacillus plantiphilus TaxID=2905650 RepID=A0ABM9C8B5_9BACL|nr:hypothetical protein [Paenibacillus plantiphilus]CAH1205829.1 hypothetical protein PAECIP111893_02432 [Paenibacillus plantiphilus]